jgi:hypothetical protein
MNEPDMKRNPLPATRTSVNRRFTLNYFDEREERQELKLYIIVGFYENGHIGEVFIRADRVGSFLAGALDTIAMIVSISLQYGIPIGELTTKLRNQKFGPSGLTGDAEFRTCTSPFDLVAQYLDALEAKRLAAIPST